MSFASSKGLVFQVLILIDHQDLISFFTGEASPCQTLYLTKTLLYFTPKPNNVLRSFFFSPRSPGAAPTSGIHRAQLTCTHLVPLRVGFMAPPFLGHSRHLGWTPSAHVRHSQLPSGTFRIP